MFSPIHPPTYTYAHIQQHPPTHTCIYGHEHTIACTHKYFDTHVHSHTVSLSISGALPQRCGETAFGLASPADAPLGGSRKAFPETQRLISTGRHHRCTICTPHPRTYPSVHCSCTVDVPRPRQCTLYVPCCDRHHHKLAQTGTRDSYDMRRLSRAIKEGRQRGQTSDSTWADGGAENALSVTLQIHKARQSPSLVLPPAQQPQLCK